MLPVLSGGDAVPPFRRERLELPDGDFLDLDWLESGCTRLAILCSGLEGNSRDPGMVRLALAFASSGWDVLSWNYRGCSGEPNRLVRSYHSGATEDLSAVVKCAGDKPVALVGCSIGGNLVLKYLGEAPPEGTIFGAVTISAAMDLASTARALDGRPGNRIYLKRLIKSLCEKIRTKATILPGKFDLADLEDLHGFEHFDARFTAPTHGFRDATDYWKTCSARQFLLAVSVPTLILSAKDDPFLTPASFPCAEAAENPQLFLEAPDCGGHLGFAQSLSRNYAVERAVEFLSTLCAEHH